MKDKLEKTISDLQTDPSTPANKVLLNVLKGALREMKSLEYSKEYAEEEMGKSDSVADNSYIHTENLYDIQTAEIIQRLYNNLTVEKLEQIEADIISTMKSYKS